jgi:hypothetical protein
MRLVLPANQGSTVTHRLDPARITETAENLAQRISEKMPGSSLSNLAVELAGIARATDQRARQASRPILAIRLASATAIGLGLLGLWYLVDHIHTRWEFGTITELFEATDAGFNLLVILAGALWFLITLEARLKRKRALGSIEELREFIHVIDLTQLYYTPELYNPDDANSQNAWGFDYTYLLFCTQMIGVISNLAALYTRGAAGDSVLRAASDVEMLATAVNSKLLSKVETVGRSSASK